MVPPVRLSPPLSFPHNRIVNNILLTTVDAPTFVQFLAYYGVLSRNTSLLDEAYNQIRLYRQYLRDPSTGLWRHILFGDNQDDGLWSTGSFVCLSFVLKTKEN